MTKMWANKEKKVTHERSQKSIGAATTAAPRELAKNPPSQGGDSRSTGQLLRPLEPSVGARVRLSPFTDASHVWAESTVTQRATMTA
jgi:hypothetical protein